MRQLVHCSFQVCGIVLCRIWIVLELLWQSFCLFCVVGTSTAGLVVCVNDDFVMGSC
jgi:hypothetical protein